jgi:hypothetical protein
MVSTIDQQYKDRFGHEWQIRAERKRGTPRRFTFICGVLRLVVEEETSERAGLTPNRVKDLFCDAERVLDHDDETWYVGYRKRVGRGGRAQAGMFTRFRSESGETRYARTMLCFRHMSTEALREQLVAAERVRS